MNYRKKARADALESYHRALVAIDDLGPVMDVAKRIAAEWKRSKKGRRALARYSVGSYPGRIYLGLYMAKGDSFAKDVAMALDGLEYRAEDQDAGKLFYVTIDGRQRLDVYAYAYDGGGGACRQVQVGTQPVYQWRCDE
jgi:hypothetical protein